MAEVTLPYDMEWHIHCAGLGLGIEVSAYWAMFWEDTHASCGAVVEVLWGSVGKLELLIRWVFILETLEFRVVHCGFGGTKVEQLG